MSAVLVSLADFDSFLGGAVTAENDLRQSLLDTVEAMFLRETGRQKRPFAVAVDDRIETQKGTGSCELFLDYPIADVTVIELGHDTATPDDTLDPDDKTVVVWTVGGRQITRVDGGRWGSFGSPAYVHVTYDTQDDLPADAALAVLRVATAIYRQRGAEDASSETIGGQTSQLAKVAESDPVWQLAVASHWRMLV